MERPVKRDKASSARDTAFNNQHKLEYGLMAVGTDTKTDKIDLVACTICIAYGVEERVGTKR
ncbi:hypothetical protein KXD40_002504 [Peronospora effusa]|uniref:Uncharacterized protein n=1 Tax=Peronospora effusa TaxID=542832 RepID=A0A3M6VBB3_9STRA|nr:hypothetical protein DD238_006719 [Peronospora effusa]RQM17349.1 hypothetical protein DD237_001120 [Peronospora effusa]UIZ26336.1 hypothetical protein KXD40_002504 [Peronospora effusa]